MVFTHGLVVRPRIVRDKIYQLANVTAHGDNLTIGIWAIGLNALWEAGGHGQGVVLEGRVGVVDTRIDDRDFHAGAGVLAAS